MTPNFVGLMSSVYQWLAPDVTSFITLQNIRG